MKTILIDYSLFVHRAIYGCYVRGEIKFAQYMCIKMIIGCLKKIEIHPEDIIILAIDSKKGNWRKDVDSNYKGNRKEKRSKVNVDWEHQYGLFAALLENLDASTPFHVLEIDRLEADDIISVSSRFFRDSEIVIISTDSDYDQLATVNHVKIFNPVSKKYKIVKDSAYKLIAKKIKKETTDNLITPIRTVEDYEKRDMLVNLTRLPEDIENQVVDRLKLLPSKKVYSIGLFRYPKMTIDLEGIYNNEEKKLVTLSESFKKKVRKIKKDTLKQLF